METIVIISEVIFLLLFVLGIIKDFTGLSIGVLVAVAIIGMAIIMHSESTTETVKILSSICFLLIFVGGTMKSVKVIIDGDLLLMGILSIAVLLFPGLPIALCTIKFLFGIDLGCEF